MCKEIKDGEGYKENEERDEKSYWALIRELMVLLKLECLYSHGSFYYLFNYGMLSEILDFAYGFVNTSKKN